MPGITTTSLVASGLLALASAQVKVPAEFKPGVKWQIEIQHALSTSAPLVPTGVPVWDLDLYHLARNPDIIAHIRNQNQNAFIVCYFNAGLVQTSDCDYNTTWDTPANRGLLGRKWPEFPDERWVNIKNATSHTLIQRRITLANSLGCDAVDPDNIDGYGVDGDPSVPEEEKTGWNLSEADDVAFVRALAKHAHGLTTKRGNTLLIGQKNAPELAEELLKDLDFAVLEDCKDLRHDGRDPWCDEFQRYVTAGKPVLSIEYPRSLESPSGSGKCAASGASEAEYNASCDETKGNKGFSTVLKIKEGQGELNGCTQYCDGKKVGTGVVVTETDASKDGGKCPEGST